MDELFKKINELYGLELNSSEKVTKGFLSENHILFQDDTKFFLKRYRFSEKERIEEIHSAKNYFAKGGIPVILPLLNKSGESFFSHNGGYFAIFPFINERQLERYTLTNIAIESMGEMLGRIHLLGRSAELAIEKRFKEWNKERALERITAIESEIKKIPTLSDFDKLALKNIDMKKSLINSNVTTYGELNMPSNHLIHGDYLDHNVFFGKDDNVSHVFDFEKTDYSPRMYELWKSLMYSFISDDVGEADFDRAKLYLNSYLKIYPTSSDELKKGLKIFYLKCIHAVWVESEHYLRDNNRVDGFLIDDFKRVKYLSTNYDELESKLLTTEK